MSGEYVFQSTDLDETAQLNEAEALDYDGIWHT